MTLEEKYEIIKYNSYYSKSFYNATETVDFFDENLCKVLTEIEITNNISNLSEHFDFSKFFFNMKFGINKLQKELLEFLILKNVKNISVFLDSIDKNIKLEFLNQLYLKYKSNKNNMLGLILININEIEALSFTSLIDTEIDEDQIAYSITALYTNGKDSTLKNLLLNNNKFKETLVNRVNSPFYYEVIEELNLPAEFISNRKSNLKEIISNLESYDSNVKKEVISEYYFEDLYNNMMIDLETIKSSFESLHFSIDLSKEKALIIDFYNFFGNIDKLTDEQIKDCLTKFRINKNLITSLFNLCQEQFKKEVTSKINQPVKDKPDFYMISSDNKNVPVYDFENESGKEQFYILLSSIPCDVSAKEFKDTYCSLNNGELKYKRRSCSLIDQSKLNGIFGKKDRICFGYTDLNNKKITSATMSDGQTDGNEIKYRRTRKTRECKFIDVQEFIQNTYGHNEISIAQNGQYNVIMPSYLVVIGREPSQLEIDIASLFDIPIRRINQIKYHQIEEPKNRENEKQYCYYNFIRKEIKQKENVQFISNPDIIINKCI